MRKMSRMIEIHPNFHNLRGSFTFAMGLVDIGTHMSFIKLSSGKYLVIDTCDINATDKAKIDTMTENGNLIDAVVATHPFHTLYFRPFRQHFPNANIKYYGTPRHLRNLKDIPWAGDISQEANLHLWDSEGVFMKIPKGSDFDPVDQGNHFNSVFVFHQLSKSLHVDDTILYFDKPGCLLSTLGKKQGTMEFWDLNKGLQKTKEAPGEFRSFIEQILQEWDFDNIIAAHTGNKIGGAKEALRATLNGASKKLDEMSNKAK